MSWQFLVAISVITYSVSVLLQRILLKNDKTDPVAFSIVMQLFTGLLILGFSLIRGFSVPNLIPLLPNLILMILLYGTGYIIMFKALKVAEASDFTIMFSSRAVWTIIAAVIFLGEIFSFKQLLGTALILTSVTLVSYQKGSKIGQEALLSLAAAAFFGLAFTNDAFIVRNFDVSSYLSIAFITPALFIWLAVPSSTAKIKPMFEKGFFSKLTLLVILYAVSAITIFLAYQVGRNAAQIAPLNQTATIITVIMAIIFLKEKSKILRKIIGAVLSFIGVVLVG